MGKYQKLSIKNWAVEDRPRERLLSKGIQSLSNTDLVALLIGSGTKEISAVELARRILVKADNNLNMLGKFSVDDLLKQKGVGKAKAISIIAALELGRRRKLSKALERPKITSSKDVYDIIFPLISDLQHEEFWILLLNRSNKIIDKNKISQGGVAGTVIDVRIILRNAIEKLASSVILCHNHPSGNLEPSKADIGITRKLKDAAEVMDIKLLDHIIVADNSYFSFLDEGILC
ncbi:MAG: DNA repair protein RadC [Bacteroidales bacterium]|nr:MAG: DNA repair protein RadC [Bacteroidales bacterium]